MSRWFRFYDDTINDPKVLKLPEAMRWYWAAMLCIASKNDGSLPALDDISIQLRVTPSKATEIISVLVKAGLLDRTETGFAPHNWNGRQYKSDVSTERVKRYRNGQRNVSETETKRPQKQSTETDKKDTREVALVDDPWRGWFESFWVVWPNKVGRPAALKALVAAAKRGAVLDEIIAGVHTYIRDKPPDRAWLNPATFLNQNRWEDQPATVSKSDGKNGNVIASSDSLVSLISSFDGGSGEADHLRGPTRQADVRLLSQG